MEEFYRRKYLSPTYNQTAKYAESLQKDKTVAELRKQLHECKEMEEKFDDLCLSIVKLERENKKLESQQSQIQAQYIEKIKVNKAKITQLKQDVLDCRENIEARGKKMLLLEAEIDRLSSEVSRLMKEQSKTNEQKSAVTASIDENAAIISQYHSKLEAGRSKTLELKAQCQQKSSALDQAYQELKRDQGKIREEEQSNEEMKKKLEALVAERQLWQKKVMVSEAEQKEVNSLFQSQERQMKKEQALYMQMKKLNQQTSESYSINRSQVKRLVLQNQEKVDRLKKAQLKLVEAGVNLQKDQVYFQKISLKEVDSRRENQHLSQVVQQLTDVLTEQKEGYTRIISHMRQSIQQDEKAIESLVKQASMMETMMN